MQDTNQNEICVGKYTSLELVDEFELQEISWKINKFDKRIEKINNFFKENATTLFKAAAIAMGVCCINGETIAELFAVSLAGIAGAKTGRVLAHFGEWKSARKTMAAVGCMAGVVLGVVEYNNLRNFLNPENKKAEVKKPEAEFTPVISGYYQSHFRIN